MYEAPFHVNPQTWAGGDETRGCPCVRGRPAWLWPAPHRPNLPFCSLLPEGHLDLTAPCNVACGCRPEHYSPVCGSDGLVYYSPCHAGCSEAAVAGPGGQKVSAAAAHVPAIAPRTLGGPLLLPPVIGTVVAVLRCTETVAVSLRIFPLVLAVLLQGNALQLVKESPSFWFSYSL